MQLALLCLLNLYFLASTCHDLLRLGGFASRPAWLLAAPLATVVLAAWLLLDGDTWGWIFQDIMGVAYVICCMRAVELPNLKVSKPTLTILA